jgi:hypothetical protein
MKRIFLILMILSLIIFSCKKDKLMKNYQFVETVMNFPDSLNILLNDTIRVTKSYLEHKRSQSTIERYKEYLNDFKHGYTIEKDLVSEFRFINQRYNLIYDIHDIKIRSKIGNKMLIFSFSNEDNYQWKLTNISDFDASEGLP